MEFFLTPLSLLSIIGLLVAGGLGAIVLEKIFSDKGRVAGYFAHLLALAASVALLIFAGSVLVSGQGMAFGWDNLFPFFDATFRVDGLAAFFLIVIALVAIPASLYGLAYQRQFLGEYRLGLLGCLYDLFLASLILVVIANHGLLFLLVWELMSLVSYLLVVYEHRKPENVRAGFLYFLMTHFGTACIALAFLLAYAVSGSFHFDVWRQSLGEATPAFQTAIFFLVLIGFGTKAGIVPLHIWLPEAHPAAPAHVSALLSGVMIKMAILMFVRFFFDFLPMAPVIWGFAFLLLGSVSSLLGVLYALSEHDLKRLLAYHSVENIGIILLGFGAALTFFGSGMESFALFALAAALYHTLNHAIFKALLFLGAGAVAFATGTRHMEEYGGLIRLLPFTSFFFLIGSLAISAMPPFNGFASEWLTFQALFFGLGSGKILMTTVFIVAIGSLAFTGGLAAACFVKAFGATFLARPRSERAAQAKEVAMPMLFSMGWLAGWSLIFGIASTFVIASLVAVVASLGLTDPLTLQFPFTQFLSARENFANVLPLDRIAALLVVILGGVALLVGMATRRRSVTTVPTWDCGTPLTSRMEITATSFSRSLVTIFQGILKPTKQTDVEYHDDTIRYFTKTESVTVAFDDVYRRWLYRPLQAALLYAAALARRIQSGNINAYLVYVFVTFMALLVWVAHTT